MLPVGTGPKKMSNEGHSTTQIEGHSTYAEDKTTQATVSSLEKCFCSKADEHKGPGWPRHSHEKQDQQSLSWDLAESARSLWHVARNGNTKTQSYKCRILSKSSKSS